MLTYGLLFVWVLFLGYLVVGLLLTGLSLWFLFRSDSRLLRKPRWQIALLIALGMLLWPYVCWEVFLEGVEERRREQARRKWEREGTPAVLPPVISPEQELLDKIPSVPGETRAVYCCTSCGRIYGRRYIPGGLGEGVTYNPCLCVATGQRVGAREILSTED